MASKTLYLVDGSGFIFRAYHALPPLTRSDGTPVGAVLGFANMILRLEKEWQAPHLAVIFDAGRYNFRHDLFPAYKSNRVQTPDDLIPQFSLIRDLCQAFSLPTIEVEGYEADDLIASYTLAAVNKGYDVRIVSSDKDLMQLVGDQVTMLDPIKNKIIDREGVLEKFGVLPTQVVDVQALIGDASDHVPGVPGIGIKTAADLIQKYGSLENLLANAAEIPQTKRRESLLQFADQARLSYQLVSLVGDMPLPLPLSDLGRRDYDPRTLKLFLDTQGFQSLIKRLDLGEPAPSLRPGSDQMKTNYHLVTTVDDLQAWMNRIQSKGQVVIDTETTSIDAMQAKLVGISLSVQEGEACYIPINHAQRPRLGEKTIAQLSLEQVRESLGPLLADEGILKIGQNIKYDMLVLQNHGFQVRQVTDTMLLSYVSEPGPHNLDELAKRHCGHQMIAFKDVVNKKTGADTFADVPLDQALAYAAEDADYTGRLYRILKPQVTSQQVTSVYERTERPLIHVLVNMEARGIKVDPARLKTLSQEFEAKCVDLETKIHQAAGTSFNLASPKQLGEVLFETLKLGKGSKTKTGAFGTGADVLEALALEGHQIARDVLEWRQFAKLKSTYTDALPQKINPKTGRVHTSYAMATAFTGRLASSDPNLQNIPIRTDEGLKIREAFVAKEGCTLLSFDYSQIELRLMAHVADIGPLKDAFQKGLDVHKITASQVFGVPEAQVTPDMRRRAKAINFGIIYGISAYGLAQQLGISNQEAAAYMKTYDAQYPGIRAYMERQKEFARSHGYVETAFGRRCYVPLILSKNGMQRSFAERQAINAPIQGGAADIIKRAMIKVEGALKESSTQMLLQVHDELIFETPLDTLNTITPIIQDLMEHAVDLSVPLVVDAGHGPNWRAAKG